MSIHNNPAVILDNGSGYLKCGMSNNQFPDFSLPALVGRPMLRYEENIEGIQIKVSKYHIFLVFLKYLLHIFSLL